MSAPITPVVFGVALMSEGIAQLITGAIQFRTGYTYAGVLSGAFWLSLCGIAEFSLKGIPAGHAGQVLGLFLYAFGIFTVIMLIASLRTNVVIVVALAGLVATFFVLDAGNYYGSGRTVETGGYLGLVAAALAACIALAELREAAYKRVVVPHWPLAKHRYHRKGVSSWAAIRRRSTGASPIPKASGARPPRTSTGTRHPP